MRGSEFIFNSVQLLYYKCHKANFERVCVCVCVWGGGGGGGRGVCGGGGWGAYIDSPVWMKIRKQQ